MIPSQRALGRQIVVREQLWLLRTLAIEITVVEALKAKDYSDALRKALYGVLSTTMRQFHWTVNQETGHTCATVLFM